LIKVKLHISGEGNFSPAIEWATGSSSLNELDLSVSSATPQKISVSSNPAHNLKKLLVKFEG